LPRSSLTTVQNVLRMGSALFVACLSSLAVITHSCVTRMTGGGVKKPRRPRYVRLGATCSLLVIVSLVVLIDLSDFSARAAKRSMECPKLLWCTYDRRALAKTRHWRRTSIPRRNYTTALNNCRSTKTRAHAYYGHQPALATPSTISKTSPARSIATGRRRAGHRYPCCYPDAGDSVTFYGDNPTVIE